MSPNFSCWASSLKVILMLLQSLPVLLPIITFSVALHSFYHSVATRISPGLTSIGLLSFSAPQFAIFVWITSTSQLHHLKLASHYLHTIRMSGWSSTMAMMKLNEVKHEHKWMIQFLDQTYWLPAIHRAFQNLEQPRKCIHATISFLHLTHNRSPFSIIRLHTVKSFPLKPLSFFKARLCPLSIPDPRRVKLHVLIWSPQFRLCNMFINFSPNFRSNLPRSTGRWANSRLQCSSRPNEAWPPGSPSTSYSECLRKVVFLHLCSWERKDGTLWIEIRLEETRNELPWNGQRVSMPWSELFSDFQSRVWLQSALQAPWKPKRFTCKQNDERVVPKDRVWMRLQPL